MPTHLRLFLGVLGLFFLVSCSSSHSSNDTDMIPDSDFETQDSETVDDDSDTQDAEIVDDSDVKPDVDADQDTDSSECQPSLSEAPFPYYDANGKITFCRPNCDTPTEDDPICIGNLWDEQNEKLCHEYPEYACCGTPCVMESLKPWTKERLAEEYPTLVEFIPMHKCDLAISQVNWGIDGSAGVVKSWNLSDGKIGFHMYPTQVNYQKYPSKRKYIIYNIVTQKYSLVIPSRGQEQAYYKGKRLGLISDKRSLDLNNENIFLAYIGDDGKTEIVYDKKVKSISYEPALNEKWAFVNLVEAGNERMMYAKVGEWKWTSLGNGSGWFPSLVGNTLSFVDDNVNGWICDLSQKPQKLEDCLKFNQDGEQTEYLYFDKENENRFVYYDTFKRKIVLVERNGDKFERKDLITEFTEESASKAYSVPPRMLRGNLLLYEEVTTNGATYGGRLCYYRIDKNKKYCMNKMEDDKTYSDGTTIFPYGFSEFEDQMLLYQTRGSTSLILRNMECYCSETGICPFE